MGLVLFNPINSNSWGNFLSDAKDKKHAFFVRTVGKPNFPHPPTGRAVGRKLQHTQPLSMTKIKNFKKNKKSTCTFI